MEGIGWTLNRRMGEEGIRNNRTKDWMGRRDASHGGAVGIGKGDYYWNI
jgi:hypothetical protein